jgi:hypothetical protein
MAPSVLIQLDGRSEGIAMKVVLMLCGVAILCPALAWACGGPPATGIPGEPVENKLTSQIGEPVIAVNCDLYGYNSHTDNDLVAVPDCDGVVLATMEITEDPEMPILDAILEIDFDHTWIGDMNLCVHHDLNCDGFPETNANIFCRPGLGDDTCPLDGCCGCSDDLNGIYMFDDAATGPEIGDPFFGCAGGAVAPGCYKPNTTMEVFNGEPKGGCWLLKLQDGACGDLGFLYSWTLHFLKGGGTAAESVTWSSMKSLYQ